MDRPAGYLVRTKSSLYFFTLEEGGRLVCRLLRRVSDDSAAAMRLVAPQDVIVEPWPPKVGHELHICWRGDGLYTSRARSVTPLSLDEVDMMNQSSFEVGDPSVTPEAG